MLARGASIQWSRRFASPDGTLVKLSEVARHADVSPSTVSYVLSGKRSISEQTRRRVLDSIATLGYRPHAGAQALASRRPNVIALVMPLRFGLYVPVLMQIAAAVVTTARGYGHDVLLLTQEEGVTGLQRVAGASLVDAVIVMDVETRDERLPVLRALRLPAVLIGFPAEPAGLTCIDLDFEAAGKASAEHLAAAGCRDVVLIGAPPEVYRRSTGYAQRTQAGFERAARAQGLRAATWPCDPAPGAIQATVARLLGQRPAAGRGRGAQRVRPRPAARCVPGGRAADRRGPLGARDLPGRPGRAVHPGADLDRHPGRGDGPSGGRAADGHAGRPACTRGYPAPPAAHRAGQHAPRGHAAPRLSTSRTRVSS